MTPLKANPLLDAATVLVGWTNRSATRDTEKIFTSGEVVKLNTKLDATAQFSLLVSHPGHSAAVTVVLHLAPHCATVPAAPSYPLQQSPCRQKAAGWRPTSPATTSSWMPPTPIMPTCRRSALPRPSSPPPRPREWWWA